MDCDLALVNGQVVDPATGEIFGADVAVAGGRIVAIGRDRPGFNAARVLDAGSFGPRNAAGFAEYVLRPAATRVFGLVNISRWGNSTNPGESEVMGFLNPTEVVRTIEKADGWARGVKV